MSFRFKRSTIAEELLRIEPQLLNTADPKSVLEIIRHSPTFLEYLNSNGHSSFTEDQPCTQTKVGEVDNQAEQDSEG